MNTVRRNAVAVTIGICILVITRATFAQPIKFDPACAKIKEIGEQIKKLKARREATAIGNKARWCPLNKQQINYNEEMIRIFNNDPERCGVRDSVIDRLKAANEKLRESTSTACGV
jgi:hypothetical protein